MSPEQERTSIATKNRRTTFAFFFVNIGVAVLALALTAGLTELVYPFFVWLGIQFVSNAVLVLMGVIDINAIADSMNDN
jgi:hypothetical protein